MSTYIDLAVREESLRHAARDLRNQFCYLGRIRWTRKKIKLARKMRPAFGPQSPTPDGDWSVSLEDCLLNERRDEQVPGGLLVMVEDALQYVGLAMQADLNGVQACELVERHAWQIVEKFPAVDDLVELMLAQTAYVARAISKRYPEVEFEPMTRPMTATEIVKQLAVRGTATTVDTVRGWARRGHISVTDLPNGRNGYRLDECLLHVAKITHAENPQ